MPLPVRKWFTVEEAAKELNISSCDIEHYLEIAELHPVVRVIDLHATCITMGDDPFEESGKIVIQCVKGLFEIADYFRVKWNKSEKGNKLDSFDLSGVPGKLYELATPEKVIAKSYPKARTVHRHELLITDKELLKLKTEMTDEAAPRGPFAEADGRPKTYNKEDIGDLVEKLLSEKTPREKIVVALKEKGLTLLEIGKALDLGNWSTKKEINALKKYIERLHKKGLASK